MAVPPNIGVRPPMPRSNISSASHGAMPIKAVATVGMWAGLFGALIVILWSGYSAVMAGLLVGVICGMIAAPRAAEETPLAGARVALLAALIAGILILLGQFLRYQGLEVPGYVRNVRVTAGVAMQSGVIGFVESLVIAGLLGYVRFLPERVSRLSTVAIIATLIIIFPFLDRQINLLWSENIIPILVFTLLALGLNIVVGYAGLLDLGYAAFFAIGAYTAGLLSSSHLGSQLGYAYQMNFWLVIWVAAAVAAIFGIILGAPTLPLRGDYLAIVTLGFGEIVPVVFRNLTAIEVSIPFTGIKLIGKGGSLVNLTKPLNITNGEFGINPIQQPQVKLIDLPKLTSGQLGTSQTVGAIVGVLLFLVLVALVALVLIRTLNTQQLTRTVWYTRLGTGVAAGLTLGAFAFIFFGQSESWIVAAVLAAAAALLLGIVVNRDRTLLPGLFGLVATLVGWVALLLAARVSQQQYSFSNPNQRWMWYFLIIGLMLLSVFFINRLRRSRLGRAWMAMREDELAAASMGIDIVRTKLLAFSMGATFSGFAGAYFAAYIQGIFPSTFDFSVSVLVLAMVILGGLGNMIGVVVGGLVIMSADRLFLPRISGFFQDLSATTGNANLNIDINLYRTGLFGMVLVIMMLVRPEGLIPNQRRKMELVGDPEEAARENASLTDTERDPQLAKE
ncbi:MAG: hypothetical protein NVSMB42_00660 [Herpetosiphon sp.]